MDTRQDPRLGGIAQVLQSKGRFGDSELVHLNPKEVAFLKSMSPTGELTTNPETGLQEAFLPALLPVLGGVAGGALAPSLFGAGLGATMLGTGLGSGVGGLVGSGGDLERGLMSGLLGAAGAGIGGAIFGSGGSSAAEGAAQTAVDASAAANPAMSAGMTPSSAALPGGPVVAPTMSTGMSPGPVELGAPPTPAPTPTTPGFGERFVEGLTSPGTLAGAGIALLGESTFNQPQYEMPGLDDDDDDDDGYGYVPDGLIADERARFPSAKYEPGADPEFTYFPSRVQSFQKGGMVTPGAAEAGDNVIRIMNDAERALLGEHPEPEVAIQRFKKVFGSEALEDLIMRVRGERARPQSPMIDGPGDGMDDAIPGTIDGQEPVRLSDGEFIVPADVVSALGDGSSDAGAEELQRMMDRTRMIKNGAPEQPRQMNPMEVMPV